MKRREVKLIIFLLLGAIVNVVVAWACSGFVDCQERAPVALGIRNIVGNIVPIWTCCRAGSVGVEQVAITRMPRQRGVSSIHEVTDAGLPEWAPIPQGESWGSKLEQTILFLASGWPTYSMVSECHEHDLRWTLRISARRLAALPLTTLQSMGWRTYTPSWRDAIVLRDQKSGGPFTARVLPLRPLWPGFAINTIFYAAVLWMVFAFPFVMRRRRRIKRGLCPACAYPVGGSPVCTECGVSLAPRV